MTYSLSCPNGHAWESDAANAQCPVCGSMVESRDEGESSTWDSGIDELPPPPGASVRPLLPQSGDAPPQLPGYEIASELGRGGMGCLRGAHIGALHGARPSR